MSKDFSDADNSIVNEILSLCNGLSYRKAADIIARAQGRLSKLCTVKVNLLLQDKKETD